MDEFWVANAADLALDKYIEYFEYEGNEDDGANDDLRWDFMDLAVEIFEKITGRKVVDELVY